MKRAVITFLSFAILIIVPGHCYTYRGHDPLSELINRPWKGESENEDTWDDDGDDDDSNEYIFVAPQEGLKESDRILELPGQPQVRFSQYSGYVTVDPRAGRALFYWLTETENRSSDPLVLWLAGGPGCSSVGIGGLTELGPFRVNPDGKTLCHNKHAWNTVANLLFLESPAGVGFSYSNKSSDYATGDSRTATDAYTFLINWLERFPEYKSRDFYIAGESYAGHYVPQLTQLILRKNKLANQTIINLKRIAIGNPYIDYQDMMSGIYDYLWSHALISDEHHDAILKNCNFTTKASVSEMCVEAMSAADNDRGTAFLYDIYSPLCGSNSSAPTISAFDPCSYNYTFAYLNTPEVQKAFHANISGIPGPWDMCSKFIRAWKDKPETVLPVIKDIIYSQWHYRLDLQVEIEKWDGDTDGRLPVTSTKYSLRKLNNNAAAVKTPWYPWYHQGQVGGYVIEYQNLRFVSIRGAGHFVASYQPGRAFEFFSSFLSGKLLPSRHG